MKIAIGSTGKDISSNISDIAGRAPYYLIFEDKKLIETIDNPFSFGGGGAGLSTAKMLADKNIDLVIAGRFGPKMISAMEEKNMKYRAMEGTVQDALNSN
jgi:predicted Fe-Mo cluster-binding NifX family protein